MKTWKTIVSIVLLCCLTGCKQFQFGSSLNDDSFNESSVSASLTNLSEVTVPQTIAELEKEVAQYSPLVEIISPQTGETFDRANIEIELKVTDLPLFKDERLKLGNHLVLAIDNETLPAVYDLTKPILLENLTPGTHTLRAFAVMPWGESFKTQDAYAQTTFNILTETNSNYPDSNLPLLTYNSPIGTYGAEPILLDFYLDYPKSVLEGNNKGFKNSLVKATVNGTSFTIEKWQPYYLTGFKPGENWVQIELIDESGKNIENVFNNTVRVFNYDPQQQDTLSQLVSDRISFAEAKSTVEQNYYIQPVEVPEIVGSADNTKLEISSDELNGKTTIEQLPRESALNTENNSDELETTKEETTVVDSLATTQPESDISQTLSVIDEQEVSEVQSEPDIKPIDLEIINKSVASESTTEKDLVLYSAADRTAVDKIKIEVIPDEISIDIETPEQSFAQIEVSEANSLPISEPQIAEPTTQSETSRLSPGQSTNSVAEKLRITVPTEKQSPTIKIGSDAIAISPSTIQTDLPDSETNTKFLWWKKLLVGIRQQIESLARKLPSEV